MKLEDALTAAIEFETGAVRLYADAAGAASEDTGRRVFGVLGSEERHHVAYLQSRLTEWRRDGTLTLEELATAVPSRARVEAGLDRVRGEMTARPSGDELASLNQALQMETETNRFYKRLVAELPDEGRRLFGRFLGIEDGHLAIVQAEINYLTGKGMLFDFRGLA